MNWTSRVGLGAMASALAFGLLTTFNGVSHAENAIALPAPAQEGAEPGNSAVAVLAGGCFWGLELVFENLKGVKSVTNGFAGGKAGTATYDQVLTEKTGHAEAVRIVYDPRIIHYGTLLRIFFSVAHDPTQLNRQGPDSGPSYRSAIFPQTPGQRATAEAYIAQLGKAGRFSRSIVTRMESGPFYAAEGYHQDFARRNPRHGYIQRWDAPKLVALRKAYPALVK